MSRNVDQRKIPKKFRKINSSGTTVGLNMLPLQVSREHIVGLTLHEL